MTPDEIVDACRLLGEALDLITLDGPKGPQPDQFRVLQAVADLLRSVREADRRIQQDVAADVPRGKPVEIDGRWYLRDDARSVTGWDTDAVRSKITAYALAPILSDRYTGEAREPTAAEAVAAMWRLVQPATGRTKVMREQVGVTADEYANVTTTKKLKEVQP